MDDIIVRPKARPRSEQRRLVEGERVSLDGKVYRVTLVNDCLARLVPESKRHVVIEHAAGAVVEFDRPEAALDVSPFSIVEHLS